MQFRQAKLGKDGFLFHLAPGQLWVDCSTVNPSFSRDMAEQAYRRRIRFMDSPVTGSRNEAAAAALSFWVGGNQADLEACRPLLACMGKKILYAGGNGMGAALKMVMNQFLGTTMAAFAEGLVLGESMGVARATLLDALLNGPAAGPMVTAKSKRIECGNFDADFSLRWLQKDLHLASISGYESGAALPLTNAVKEVYRLAIRAGFGDKDISVIYQYLAQNYESNTSTMFDDSPLTRRGFLQPSLSRNGSITLRPQGR